jgi:hypothetical protein
MYKEFFAGEGELEDKFFAKEAALNKGNLYNRVDECFRFVPAAIPLRRVLLVL